VVVLATGLVRGLVEVGSLGALFNTSYGVTLLIKVGLVVILVALGALNHFRWVPALRTRDGAARSFRLNSSGELALAAAVLLATAVLTGFAPASSAVASAPAVVTATGNDYATTLRVTLTASPGVAGRNEYLVRVEGYDSGDPLSGVAAVKLEFSLPDDPSLGTSSLKLGSGSGGTWRGAGMQLSVAGRWRANVVVEQAAGGAAVPLDLDVRAP
jgi:copper transport protein